MGNALNIADSLGKTAKFTLGEGLSGASSTVLGANAQVDVRPPHPPIFNVASSPRSLIASGDTSLYAVANPLLPLCYSP